MTYVMSDIHGQYEKYIKMLELINFKDTDELYILGDIVDRGPKSIELLIDMSMRTNVFPIIGNHDMTALMLLKRLCVEITEENYKTQLDEELLQVFSMWQLDGGQETLDGFRALSNDDKTALIEYMEEFLPYEALEVNGNRFILVHGGIPFEQRDVPLSKQSVYRLAAERPDYTKRYYKNIYLVTGHTPTVNIDEKYKGRIYSENGHIAIDCGAGYGMPLGCIRLDDFKEFYVA